MEFTVTIGGIITAASVLAAVVAIVGYYNKLFKWIQKQNENSKDISEIKTEQAIHTYGILACLKGLAEQGCDGPVKEAINEIERHMNKQAHK